MFLNGEASDEIEINDYATVVYYHEETKMIFAYSNDGDNKGATEGRIKAIYYDSSDPFTPVTVVLKYITIRTMRITETNSSLPARRCSICFPCTASSRWETMWPSSGKRAETRKMRLIRRSMWLEIIKEEADPWKKEERQKK